MNAAMGPGWYYAQGDPIGTNRYWDGAAWIGGPEPVGNQAGGPPGYAAQPQVDVATWGMRAGAWLVDFVCMTVVSVVAVVIVALIMAATVGSSDGSDASDAAIILVFLIGILALFAIQIAYFGAYQGATGHTLGKKLVSIQLVKESTLLPPGVGTGIGRFLIAWLLGSVTGVYAIIDYLWPLWDAKSQRLTDKMVSTIVVRA